MFAANLDDRATGAERERLRRLGEKRAVRILGMSRSTLARIAAGWACHPKTIARFRVQLELARARGLL